MNVRDLAEANQHRARQQRGPVPTHVVDVKYTCPRCSKEYLARFGWSQHAPSTIQDQTNWCVDHPGFEPVACVPSLPVVSELPRVAAPLILQPTDLRRTS